jgi:PAS domain S-box-containing protein
MRAIFDVSPFGIAASDPDGIIIESNPAYQRMLGYSADELRGMRICDLSEPDAFTENARVFAEMNTGERDDYVIEKAYRRKDGSLVWGRVTARAVRDETGALEYSVAMVEDITEQRQMAQALAESGQRAERAVRESEELFRSLTEHTAELISVTGADGKFTYISPAIERILGWNPKELIGDTMVGLVHPDDLVRTQDAMVEVMQSAGASMMVSVRVRTRDGEWRVLEGSLTNLLDHPGVHGIVSNARDVTDRVAAEDGIRFQAHLLNTVEEAVFATDTEGRILYWNRHAERLLGWAAHDVIGQKFQGLILDQAIQADAVFFANVKAGRLGRSHERVLRRKDGTTFTAAGTVSPLFAQECGVDGVVAVFTDITTRLQLEEQLRHSQKMDAVGKLAGGIAHDFNNLLTVIIGRAEFMRVSPAGSVDWHCDIEEIRDAAGRAAALTRQLLAYSRKQMLLPKHLFINDVVDGLSAMLQRLIGEDIELVTRPAADVADIHADPGQLEQVLVNLVVNARDAMPHGGVIVIGTRNETLTPDSEIARKNDGTAGKFVVLSVTDTGVGMDTSTASRIFEPFFTTKEVGHGTGLGLSTVYGIAKQSGGFITVRTKPGAGASFELYLPAIVDEPESLDASPAARPEWRGSETILLVEDSDAVRNLARQILRQLGYAVMTARDGREALELAANDPSRIDLLLTDVVMPHMSGRELAEAVRTRRPAIKVLYMSGYTDDVILQKGLREPGASLMEKPFTMATLAERVRQQLDA